jgi:hypothetical protein
MVNKCKEEATGKWEIKEKKIEGISNQESVKVESYKQHSEKWSAQTTWHKQHIKHSEEWGFMGLEYREDGTGTWYW